MRLRQRPAPTLGAGWVRPRWLADEADGAEGNADRRRWTAVGNLDSEWRARVDLAGLVQVGDGDWALDWWIGAEDRWHLPAREASVVQVLVGSSPVVETRMRVPSGDAVQRVYGARGPRGEDVVVVEIENASTVPFAVALAVRPYGVEALGRVGRLGLEGPLVRIEGAPAIVLARSPGRVAASTCDAGDAGTIVLSGRADPVGPVEIVDAEGQATLALVFPLAHTATLRVALLAPGTDPTVLDPKALPSADQVASGWVTHTRRAARIEVPEPRLREALAASSRHLLVADRTPVVASALDLLGLADEAAEALLLLPEAFARELPGAALHALARHHALTGDRELAAAFAPLAAGLTTALGSSTSPRDRAVGHRALGDVAGLLLAAGERRAAGDVRVLSATVAAEPCVGSGADPLRPAEVLLDASMVLRAGDAAGLDALVRVLDVASPTFAWPTAVPPTPLDAGMGLGHDPAVNAALVTLLRHLLVDEVEAPTGGPGLVLSPVVPETWLGAGWEVHDLPTTHGRLSFAVRWHADRPALLWELRPHESSGTEAVLLTIPGLDPTWRTLEPEGEALLAAVELPERAQRRGLSIPVTIEPVAPRRR